MKYVWAIVESVATVWIAYYVLSKVSARFEVIVVALLLMTYVTSRTALAILGKGLWQAFTGLSGFQILILKRLGEPEVGRVEREIAGAMQKAKDFAPGDIVVFGLGVVDLLCLYRLLTA